MIPQMPQGPTQQAPGQAPMTGQMGNALPNMLAQQKGSAPPPQVGQLARMPVNQLKQLFFQTMSMDTGLQPLTVLAAIKQASESQKLQQAIQGQQFRDQAAQQPGTVRDDILQSSYAGGGIVALNKGGAVAFSDGPNEFGLPYPNDETAQRLDELRLEQNEPKRQARKEELRLINEQLADAAKRRKLADLEERRTNALAENNQALASQLQQQSEAVKVRQSDAGPYPETAGLRYPAPTKSTRPAPRALPRPGGVQTLAAPPAMESIEEERKGLAGTLERRMKAAEAQKTLPPELRSAQEGITSLLTKSAEAVGTERDRVRETAERRMQEARARSERPGYMDPEVLGEILSGMQGSKNLSGALTGGGAGAGKAVAKRNAALRAAEEKYDLQQGELFRIDNARREIEMKKAERAEAIARGDWERANKAEQDIIAAQDFYNKASMEVKFKMGEFGLKSRELDLKSQELLQKAQQTRLMAEQVGDTRLANAISLAQARVQQSRDGIKKVVEGALGPMAAMYQMDPSKFSKDQPELYKRVQDAVKDYQNNVMKPADDSLSRLIAQSESRSAGGQKVVTWGDIPGG